jgi:CRISPR-associated protein Cas1
MKKHLNTLYVTTQGAYLFKEGETVAVKVENETRMRLPMHTLDGIVCFGRVSCSPYLMGACADRNVAISFLTEKGRFLARVQGPVAGNVLLRREQYRKADEKAYTTAVARAVLAGKLANSRTVLRRALRDHGDKIDAGNIEKASAHISALLNEINVHKHLNVLRGVEGDAARAYFAVFDHLVTTNKEKFRFNGRNRRPPLDKINCLLSFTYTLLLHDVRSAIECVGLDPDVGFLHRDRPGRPGLALDIMEEFRPCIADRLVLSLINLGQVAAKGFRNLETGAVLMDDHTRKKVLVAYQKRKQNEVFHPFLNEKVTLGMIFQIQALLMARYLRGDLDGYPPFVWR